MNFVVCVVN